jgi:hypothetical protein
MCGPLYCITYLEQDVLQPKRKDILPLKLPKTSAKNISKEKIRKEKLLEECKLQELQKEAETYQPTEDKVSTIRSSETMLYSFVSVYQTM